MCEWLKQAVLKTAVPETVPGVRIPLPPPFTRLAGKNLHNLLHSTRNRAPLLWSTKWRTVGVLQCSRQLAHGRNCVYSGCLDVTCLRDRDGTCVAECGFALESRTREHAISGQFLRRQYFVERPDCRFVVLRLFSTHVLWLSLSSLQCMGVR